MDSSGRPPDISALPTFFQFKQVKILATRIWERLFWWINAAWYGF